MEPSTQPPENFAGLWSEDSQLQNEAFSHVIALTDSPVAWAYEVWDDVLANLTHKDNHNRAIAAQILCNLANSDPQSRIVEDFDRLFAVTRDERFVTARHCMQALWKVGVAGKRQQARLVAALEGRFQDCAAEKNCTLIRYDIIQNLRTLFDVLHDEEMRRVALRLIETEDDLKYRKKYAGLWQSRR